MSAPSAALGIGFGPGTFGFPPPSEIVEYAERAEAVGYRHFWANDHLSWPHPLLDPTVLLSFVAARTTEMRVATGVYLLPARQPVAVARAFASLDFLSSGRAILGVGVGGEFEQDFSAGAVSMSERGARTDHMVPLLRRLWTGESVTHTDRFFNLTDVTVQPTPHQRSIPIIVGGRSDAALRRVARLGDGWMPYLMAPDRIADGVQRIAALDPEGVSPRRVIAHVFVSFGNSDAAARDHAIRYLSTQYRQDMERAVDRSVPYGSPAAVAERLRAYTAAGATDIVVRPLNGPDTLIATIRGAGAQLASEWSSTATH